MCFSKEASFIASGALLVAGAVAVGIAVKRKQRPFLPFAFIPCLFAIQQFFEGWVWIFLEQKNSQEVVIFSTCYLFFAFFIWPFWIPFALWSMERTRKALFTYFTIYGTIVGLIFFVTYLTHLPQAYVAIRGHSIQYATHHYAIVTFIPMALYIVATVGATLFSSYNSIKVGGILTAVMAIISYFINQCAFSSLWCFFSAAISVGIIWIIHQETTLSI